MYAGKPPPRMCAGLIIRSSPSHRFVVQTARQAPQTRGGTRDTTTEDRQRSGRTPHGRDDGTDDDDCTALRGLQPTRNDEFDQHTRRTQRERRPTTTTANENKTCVVGGCCPRPAAQAEAYRVQQPPAPPSRRFLFVIFFWLLPAASTTSSSANKLMYNAGRSTRWTPKCSACRTVATQSAAHSSAAAARAVAAARLLVLPRESRQNAVLTA